jgi:hypothetical protein
MYLYIIRVLSKISMFVVRFWLVNSVFWEYISFFIYHLNLWLMLFLVPFMTIEYVVLISKLFMFYLFLLLFKKLNSLVS